ncbi:MAG: hypothetical protein KDE20_15370 [Caldilineaceae bacterium]|nr:hypothetical protein [Caldilineaceae bacterium]
MGNVFVKSGHVRDILSDATTTVTGAWQFKDAPKAAIQATVVGTGAVTATIVIEASNDGTYALATVIGTITLSGTTSDSDGFTTDAPWKFIRARITAISGTSATVNVTASA